MEIQNDTTNLSDRVIETVEKCPNYTIRPTRLAAQLGISIDDASAELCGLLAAVGGGPDGATFTFEKPSESVIENKKFNEKDEQRQPTPVMVFTFPPNFAARARRNVRKESMKEIMMGLVQFGINFLKVFISLGLILSLFILSIAILIVSLSILVAMMTQQRGGNNNHTRNLSHFIRRHLGMFRQLLWCYAIFGGAMDNNNPESIHPFLREVAMIMANLLAICNGSSVFYPLFWMRMRQNSRRMNGFGSRFGRHTELQGAAEIRRGTWNDNNTVQNEDSDSFRGFLSVAVEFLFGPTPFWPGPTDRLKWRLRAEIITSKNKAEISLQELAAFVDDPPKTLQDHKKILASGLEVVTHFNGIPVIYQESGKSNDINSGASKSIFRFPELLAEAEDGGLPTPKSYISAIEDPSSTNQIWSKNLFFRENSIQPSSSSTEMNALTLYRENGIPNYLYEQRHSLTKLTSKQFIYCLSLGLLNYIGMVWLRASLTLRGQLATIITVPSLTTLLQILVSILLFYAKLFFILPLVRLVVILILNFRVDERNRRRKHIFKCFVENSKTSKTTNNEEPIAI